MPQAPIAYQAGGAAVLCSTSCLPARTAQLITDSLDGRLTDGNPPLGDVHPWTVELDAGDDDLRCDGCGRVLVQRPTPNAGEPGADPSRTSAN